MKDAGLDDIIYSDSLLCIYLAEPADQQEKNLELRGIVMTSFFYFFYKID